MARETSTSLSCPASVDNKLESLRQKTIVGFERVAHDFETMAEQILVLEDSIGELQARVKSLEDMVIMRRRV
jgi:hypothetical protein